MMNLDLLQSGHALNVESKNMVALNNFEDSEFGFGSPNLRTLKEEQVLDDLHCSFSRCFKLCWDSESISTNLFSLSRCLGDENETYGSSAQYKETGFTISQEDHNDEMI